jgi:hypothetical protein
MNALWWVIGIAVAAGVGVVGTGYGDAAAVALGIAGPVIAAGASWTMTTRTWARDQAALLPWMLRAFAAKVVFFVGYVAVMLGMFDTRQWPFVASLTVTFLATHLAEAYCLRRLMAPVLAPGQRRLG